jgi:hypothetical protein
MTSGSYLKSPEHRKHLSESRQGMKFSDEHRKNLSLAHMGHAPIISKEVYKIIAAKNTGKKRTEENKAKLRITRARQIMAPRTPEYRRKMSEARKGDKWYTWKGGITKINLAARNGVEYKLWREAVFARDNWTCIHCGIRSCKGVQAILHADHIKPFAYYPELRFDINNGRTLCKPCHLKTDTYGPKCKK